MERDARALSETLRKAGTGLVLVVTGAGVSAASGLPLFRGTDPDAVYLERFSGRDPRRETLPRCPRCGALLRPHVLLFDELYDEHVDYGFGEVRRGAARSRRHRPPRASRGDPAGGLPGAGDRGS